MRKILVSGGCGYIGSHTITDLLNNDYQVISVDNHSRSSIKIIDQVHEITGKSFINYSIDLCKINHLREIFLEHPDISGIIHFAAFKSVPESVQRPLMYYHNNLISLLNLLLLSVEFNIDKFVFSSSCSVYGNIDELPVRETTAINKAECPYAFTKQIGEQMIIDTLQAHKLKAVILRYFNPVGAHESGKLGELPIGEPENLVPRITQTAIGLRDNFLIYGNDYDTRDGTCIRDYIHVMDIAEAHRTALEFLQNQAPEFKYEIFNLGSSKGVTVLEAVNAFMESSGQKLYYSFGPRRSGDVISIYSDISKATTKLSWKPNRNIDEMMRSAWKWELFLSKNRNFFN